MPPLVIVAAVARNGVIGQDNRLIWRLKSDMRHFRALTLGKPVIMGRKTFDSIGRPLPGRETVLLTRARLLRIDGVHVTHSLDEAMAMAGTCAQRMGVGEAYVAGGGEIYRALMPHAQRMEITEVGLEPEGDATFPAILRSEWREVKREAHKAGPDDEADFSFVTYARR